MKHRHMECGKLHIYHDLVLDQKVTVNAYLTSLLREALDVDQKMVMLGVGCYQNIFSHRCVQHQHYHFVVHIQSLMEQGV